MIGNHIDVFFTFFGSDLGDKEKERKRSVFASTRAILFTVDISHMLKLQTAPKTTLASCIYNLRNH